MSAPTSTSAQVRAGDGPRSKELRLVPAALGAWATAGIIIGIDPTGPLGVIAGALWAIAALAALLALRSRAWVYVSISLTASALLATIVTVRAPERLPESLGAAVERGAVEMMVTATGPERGGRVAALASLPGEPDAAHVLLFLPHSAETEPALRVRMGETWIMTASVRLADPADDVVLLAFVREVGARLGESPPVFAATDRLRSGLRDVAAQLPGRGAQLLPGLAVGDTTAVDDALDADMKTSSLSHLTAVSGANCAIVVGAVFAVCAAVGMPRAGRVTTSLLALTGFVVLVTPEPSVLRAAVMAAAVLLGLGLGRPARGIPVLCLAVLALLVVDPWLARSYGFALSALATAGLLLLAAPLARVLARWMPSPLALVVAVPLAAQLACQPVLVLLSPSLPLWGVPANMLAGPAAPLATVVGLVACLLMPIVPGVAEALASIAWLPATWIAATAELFSGLPGARLPWPGGAVGLALVSLLTAILLAALLAPQGARWRRAAAALALVALTGVVGTAVAQKVADALTRPADWQYAMCDVGQGDALVIRSGQRAALVDTGTDPARLSACLDSLGIGVIDLLVLTHYDTDHVGGVDAIAGRVELVLAGAPDDDAERAILDRLRAHGAAVSIARAGLRGGLGSHTWQVLWPPLRDPVEGNAASVAMRVDPSPACSGCLSALLLGDLGEQEQIRLAARAPVRPVDLLKVAHHGSGDTSAALVAAARAPIALIGVGADNSYGHPAPRALEGLAAAGSTVFRTDTDGLILVGPSGVWAERQPTRDGQVGTGVGDAQ